MKTLILSNYLNTESSTKIICAKWGVDHPSIADFQSVVLDMKLDTDVASADPSVHYHGYSFYNLSDDIIRLLQAGGVVICLNYYTFINLDKLLFGTKVLNVIYQNKISNFNYEHKFQGQEETSYDWLDLGFLKCTQLDRMNIRPGKSFKVLSNLDAVKNYFSFVKDYHKIVQGIIRESSAQRGQIRSTFREYPDYGSCTHTEDEVEILAVTEVTDEPIAVAIKYRKFPGKLIFLPTYHLPEASDPGQKETIRFICSRLASLGEHYYEKSRQELGAKLESPPWLLKYRAKPARDADEKLKGLEKKKDELIAERDKYDRMLTCINGYGTPLEKTLGELFGKEWFGFEVDKTEPGHPVDLFVKNSSTGQTLAIQSTGVVGKFIQSDRHFGALMGYLPESEGKNTSGRVERVVLVVNTYRDTDLADRKDDSDISMPVQNLVKKNEICLIRSVDLYNLWAKFPEKISADEIFKQLFECEGIWQQK